MVIYVLLRILRLFFEILPWPLARGVAFGLGSVLATLGPRRGVIAERMRRHVDPHMTAARCRKLVHDNYHHYALSMVEFMRLRLLLDKERRQRFLRVKGVRHLMEPKPEGHLVVTAHLGNFVCCAAIPGLVGTDLAVVIKHVRHKGLERFWVEQLRVTGIEVLFNRGSMSDIMRVLKRGGILGFIYDQHDSRGGAWVDFLGDYAAAFRALPALARRRKQVVTPIFTYRTREHRHVLKADAIIPVPDGERDQVDAELAQAYSDAIGRAVRRHPEQWLWLHRRWRKPPPEGLFSARAQALSAATDQVVE